MASLTPLGRETLHLKVTDEDGEGALLMVEGSKGERQRDGSFMYRIRIRGPFGDATADALWLAAGDGDAAAAFALADRLRELGREKQ